ncbi:hypothetical protein BO70DRAFT_363718 [Aspergillus heteromorphus CBS 117.55]|uniref:Uncharacterized protein n=1 Tax=Aspergillus heteromorphus CBS 117.55 TaxID=1448321 RepID=A0A317VRH3_9EURO|nr:uncharacterized protein BO70DRAFT_363718 [Aspergillus heteromorphus CBS 117.55]PWY76159.1 hypothetical protein BO70DRAFT_363718 [Aspergillus heteromorphus CBS 117.55]
MSTLLNNCPFCGQATDISNTLTGFMVNPYCSQCGLSATESTLNLPDDLVTLFDKSMNIGFPLSPGEDLGKCFPHGSSAMYSVSQHYHHSAHIARQSATEDSLGVKASIHSNSTDCIVAEKLRQHQIDHSSLSSKQLELFERAVPEQQLRLIQIWQISPEHRYNIGGNSLPMPEKSDRPSIATEASNPFYRTFAADGQTPEDGVQYAEPYMLSGYEAMAQENNELSAKQVMCVVNEPTRGSLYRLASDPVYYYCQSRRWWETEQSGALNN